MSIIDRFLHHPEQPVLPPEETPLSPFDAVKSLDYNRFISLIESSSDSLTRRSRLMVNPYGQSYEPPVGVKKIEIITREVTPRGHTPEFYNDEHVLKVIAAYLHVEVHGDLSQLNSSHAKLLADAYEYKKGLKTTTREDRRFYNHQAERLRTWAAAHEEPQKQS